MGNPIQDAKVGVQLVENQIREGHLITLEEAAARLHVSKQAIRKFKDKGLESVFYGRKLYVSAEGVEALKGRDTKRGRKPKTSW